MPISVLLTLLTALCILHAILLYGQPIIPSLDDLQQESLFPDVTAANALVKLRHDASALISTYAREDRVGDIVAEKISIHHGISPCVPLDSLGLY